MPDSWTLIPDAKDAHRYKAIGNSMAVPVMRWIGEGIAAVNLE
jgi:DNA (cytosine-5)-methyltransferase 1